MLNKALKYFIENKLITIVVFIVISILSIVSIYKTPIDALPDLSENQVVVMTSWEWQTPKNIEDQITYPITTSMQSLAWVKDVRAMSQLWISMVTIIFNDNVDKYFARDRVNERLNFIKWKLPSWVEPVLWPDATGLWQVYMYTLESNNHSLTELRSIQDFYVKLWLESVSWVAEVASIWWYKKTFQVILDPLKLSNYNLTLWEIQKIIKSWNNNVSWRVIDIWWNDIAIEWIWFIEKKEDLENIFIKEIDWVKIKLQDIANIKIWAEFRRWILANESEEKVWWIVVMRYDKNPLEVINNVKEKIQSLKKWLPDWIKIEAFYDRTNLIKNAINTLSSIITAEIIITIIILFIFLWNFGASFINAISLIIWILITFLLMKFFNIPSNIMSLWWIAIAIWTMIDASIVVTENAYNKLIWKEKLNNKKKSLIIYESTKEIAWPLIFAIFIIILSFIPILGLEWQEWKLFSPLAFTNMFAMLWALFTALFLVPVLIVFLLKWKLKNDNQIPIIKLLNKVYKPILNFSLKKRKIVLTISWIIFIIWISLFTRIWSEFMPPLDEWSIMYMPMTVPDVSEKRARDLLIESNRIISNIPEVEKVVWKAWRALTATDPAPMAMLETIITLKPKSEWREWVTKQDIMDEMNKNIKISKLWNWFTQPIIWRIDMLSTWIRSQVGIKIFWDDPMKLEEIAIKVEELMSKVPWWFWITAIRTTWLKYLQIDIDEKKLNNYSIKKEKVLDMISIGIWGKNISTTIDWRERYKINMRLNNDYRDNIDDIKDLMVSWKSWNITLSQIADISLIDWPAIINSENWIIRSAVQMNVKWVDLVSFVEDSKKHIEESIDLPEWYYIEWAWQYQNQIRAKSTLQIIVPTVIFIILFILFLTYKDIWLVWIISISIPFSLIGWIIALYISWFNFSVAVWVWFIALFWNAVETWIVMILYLENSFRQKFNLPLMDENKVLDKSYYNNKNIDKKSIHESVIEWAMLRLRPILMTAFTSIIWLLPMIWSTWTWAELQKPLAIVVVWWLITSIILTLIILPILFSYLKERKINY